MSEHGSSPTQLLARPKGRIALDVAGEGPLVICAPGMGDLRSVFRFLRPDLIAAGFRVATFDSYDDVATGEDLLALTQHLGGRAVLVGNSMSAGAAVWAAAQAPEAVAGLVLIGPFVRSTPVGLMAVLAFRLALMRPWGLGAWTSYYRRLYPGRPPSDLSDHQARMRESLRRPGHWQAFVATTHTSRQPVEESLAEVNAPVLVVMGTDDPDFKDPSAEARLVAERLQGQVLMVPNAGHYPQAEYPETVVPRVIEFLTEGLRHAQS